MTTDQKSPDAIASAHHGRELYTIPSRSSWFLWDEIHETEKRELPDFFDGSSFSRNPRAYKEYRDFVINRYREDPSRRLTFTEVRRSLVGDAGALHRVFLFLDRWGLINFSAAERSKAPADGGACVLPVVVENGLKSSTKVLPFPNAAKGLPPRPSSPGPKAAGEGGGGFRLPPLTSYSDVFGHRKPLAGRVCGDCGEECVSGYYESKSGIVVCTKCFKNENCAAGSSVGDYKFTDQILDSGKYSTSEWTDTETLSLLEAIVSKGPDWDLIANHVRRSRLDCIAKSIQLPFGEHMLGSISGKYDLGQRTEESIQTRPDMLQESVKPDVQEHENSVEEEHIAEESESGPPQKRRHFDLLADTSDSLMEKVASLSALAGPHVAAAAAGAAISALCDEHPYAKKVFALDDNEANGTDFSFSPNNKLSSGLKVEDGDTEEASETAGCTTVKNFGDLTFQIRAATATAFGAAAAHAKLLSDQEDRQIEYLVASIIDMQLRKLRYKMKHFVQLESIMEKQYSLIQLLKEDILREWLDISQCAVAAGIPKWKDHGLQKSLTTKYASIT